jgi:hypothetical protein
MVTVDKNDYLLCNLSKHKFQQQNLDLNFETGDTIAFMTKGKGIVHLTGMYHWCMIRKNYKFNDMNKSLPAFSM